MNMRPLECLPGGLARKLADFAMGKVVAFEKLFVGFVSGVSIERIDLDVAGKAFEVLQCFDVAFIAFNGLDGGS